MKKVLMLIPSLDAGGAERVMSTLANGLCDTYSIEILKLKSDEPFYKLDEKVKVSSIGCTVNRKNKITSIFSKLKAGLKGFFGIKRYIKKTKPDVVVAFLGQMIKPVVIMRAFGGIKCKLIISERADPYARGKFYKWFEKKFFPKADAIVCQSKAVVDFFPKKAQKKCIVLENPINSTAIPERFQGERRKVIVGVGRLSEQKNFKLLIEAFANLNSSFGDYKLEIYGEGAQRNELEKLIDKLNLSSKVFLMGLKKNVMHVISDTSLFVLSSEFEGFPNVLIEAMASGLPVITTDFSPGVAKEIVLEQNGLIVPRNNVKELTYAIESILSDENKIESMSKENVKIKDRLGEDVILEKWKGLIDFEK